VKAIPMTHIVKRLWIPLVLVVVLAVSGLVVSRLHKIFASEDLNAAAGAGIEIVQFHPKILVYDVLALQGPPPRSTTSTPMPIPTK
jgi:Mycobacterium membrane protein